MQKKYDLGLISHDAYAEMACREYALAVKGLPAARLKEILPAYMEWDRQLLFPFTEGLFRYLKNRHIETVIITGAPGSVLEQYREYFGFKNIYAFEAEVHSGVYTGKIRCNHGSRKEGIMALLAKEYGSSPVFAFGDSPRTFRFCGRPNRPSASERQRSPAARRELCIFLRIRDRKN